MTDIPTLAAPPSAPAAPPASDAGNLGPTIERAAPSAAPEKTFAEKRFAQDHPSGEAPAADPAQPAPVGEKVKIGRFELSEQEIAEMATRIAADDVRKGSLPATPDAYKVELPADFTPPAGVEFKLDTSNPALGQLKAVAHKHGMTQEAVNELIGVYAGNEVGTEARIRAAASAEVAKLGPAGSSRVDAVTRFLDGSDMGVLKSTLVTAAQIEAWERFISKQTSQGGASFTQSHRVPPDANQIPNYDGMTFAQRREAQDQLAARQRGR
jgi:hypothetical protein